jgi:anti-sigma factor RsiW
MDCADCRHLMNEKLDGSISSEDSRELEKHVSGCPSCRSEWAALEEMDRALRQYPLDRAPGGFERSVMREIIRRVEVRRRAESIAIPVACAAAAAGVAYGVRRVINWEALWSFARGLGEAADDLLAPIAQPAAETTGTLAGWFQHPGVQGAMLAFAVAATLFLGASAIRVVRQFNLDCR